MQLSAKSRNSIYMAQYMEFCERERAAEDKRVAQYALELQKRELAKAEREANRAVRRLKREERERLALERGSDTESDTSDDEAEKARLLGPVIAYMPIIKLKPNIVDSSACLFLPVDELLSQKWRSLTTFEEKKEENTETIVSETSVDSDNNDLPITKDPSTWNFTEIPNDMDDPVNINIQSSETAVDAAGVIAEMGETSNLIIKKPIEILTSRADLLPPVVKRDTATSKRVLKDKHSPIKPAAMLQLASIHIIYIFLFITALGNGLEIAPSLIPNAGRGVYATKHFKKNAWITEYSGEIITRDTAERRRFDNKHYYIRTVDFQTLIDGIKDAHDGGISFIFLCYDIFKTAWDHY